MQEAACFCSARVRMLLPTRLPIRFQVRENMMQLGQKSLAPMEKHKDIKKHHVNVHRLELLRRPEGCPALQGSEPIVHRLCDFMSLE